MADQICEAIGCDRKRQARAWCKMHWKRWRTHGDPNYVRPKSEPPMCTIDGCQMVRHAHGLCNSHLYHQEKYGDPLAVGPGRGVGRKRTETPGYDCVHRRLKREVGEAKIFQCVGCGGMAEEWVYMGGCPEEQVQSTRGSLLRFSADQSRYSPMCRKCHRPEDDSGTRIINELGRYIATAPEYQQPDVTMTPHPRRPPIKRRARPGETPGAHITVTPAQSGDHS